MSVTELEPSLLWKHFAELCAIPRTSGNEAKAVEYVESWASSKGFDFKRDAAGNLVVYVPASKGKENSATVVLQGHLDMVGEKNKNVDHDFMKDPIRTVIDGDWVKAEGTTLGADNGIGVAASMAAAEAGFEHGPLELVFTLDEETGLTGAANLDTSLISGRTMLNLDSEEDGIFYVGCAGGGDTDLTFKLGLKDAPQSREYIRISVTGLKGGHSGCDIHENRGNAIKILARVLDSLDGLSYDLAGIEGGGKHNAIPREAEAVIGLEQGSSDEVLARVEQVMEGLLKEFGPIEPSMEVTASKLDADLPVKVLDEGSKRKVIDLLLALPHGVTAMSRDIPGLVETSTNLATVELKQGELKVLTSSRSSVAPALEALRRQIQAVASLAGGVWKHGNSYPGWQPDMESELLAVAKSVYQEMFGKEPKVTAIHAGLECGIIGDRVGGMDMLSIGPDILNPHSPDEKVGISSVQRFWKFLEALLARLAA